MTDNWQEALVEEREACAKMLDDEAKHSAYAAELQATIRARKDS